MYIIPVINYYYIIQAAVIEVFTDVRVNTI